jgi:DNA processing protein
VSESDAFLALNLLPFTPAELRRLLDGCGGAVPALEAVASGAIRAADLAFRPASAEAPEPAQTDWLARPDPPSAPSAPPSPPSPPSPSPPPRNEVPLDHGSARRLGASGLLRLAELERRRAAAESACIETLADAGYPAPLREIPDPPPVIYICGTLGPDDEARIAIVGSRRATSYGLDAAGLLAMDLAGAGAAIVSGLARGIDAAAHRGALDAGGRTIAVLGSGLGRVYPREHRSLARGIIEHGGAVLSEYPFTMPPLAHCFPRRNRVVSGLSAGIVVVEAARASGALGTARLALEQGREVFAVPGPVTHATSVGTNGLLRAQAAHIACVAQDVLDELPAVTRVRLGLPARTDDESQELRRASIGRPLGAPLPVPVARAYIEGRAPGLDPETRSVLRHLSSGQTLSIDELVVRSGLPVPRALAALSILEMQGLAVTLPGDRIARARKHFV